MFFDTTVNFDSLVKLDTGVKFSSNRNIENAWKKELNVAGVRQFDEDDALEKALALFWRKGFAATSMQELAAITGVQRGSLYNAYQDKETIFLRVFDVYRELFVSQIRESLEKPKLRDALRGFFDLVIDSMTTGVPTRGCLSTKTALGGEFVEEPIRAALTALLDELEALLTERLSKAEKGMHLKLPPRQAARLIITMTRGIVVMERVYQDEKRLRQTADEFTALLFDDSGD